PDINVRYQLAFTLGEIKLPGKMDALEQLIIRDHASSWLQAAVLSSLSQGAAELFVHLARTTDFRDPTAGQKFLRQLSTTVGSKNEPSEVAQVLSIASQMGVTENSFALMRALGEGLKRSGSSLQAIQKGGAGEHLLTQASQTASDNRAS